MLISLKRLLEAKTKYIYQQKISDKKGPGKPTGQDQINSWN